MPVSGAGKRIDHAVKSWPGVTARPHRFGGTEYRLGRREIGHVHGDITIYLREASDVDRAIELLCLSFETANQSVAG